MIVETGKSEEEVGSREGDVIPKLEAKWWLGGGLLGEGDKGLARCCGWWGA